MRISYSALDTYQTCPLKYKFQNVDKIKTPKSKEAVFGSTIHATLKFIHMPGILSPTLEQALEHFSANWNSAVFENEIEERAAFSQGVKIIQNYYQKNNPADANIVDLESRFEFPIVPAEPSQETHIVSGIIDRIDKTDEGYEVIDYKTTKKMPTQEKVDSDLQLSVYLKAFLARYPKEIANLDKIAVSLYFLKHGVKLSSRRTKEQLQKSEQLFLDIIKLIEEKKFEPTISPLCDWCGYQERCPMWKHKFKDKRKINTEEINAAIREYIELKSATAITKDRLAELQEKITKYMEQEGVERVFADDGIIARTLRKTYRYNAEKIRQILEPLGKWQEVLKIDGIVLKKIISTLPYSDRKEIESAKEIDKESKSFTVKKNNPRQSGIS